MSMSNMSYCRFNNTNIDLEDCIEAIENQDIQSETEASIAKSMFRKFLDLCESEGIINEYSEDMIDDLIDGAIVKDDDE